MRAQRSKFPTMRPLKDYLIFEGPFIQSIPNLFIDKLRSDVFYFIDTRAGHVLPI